jgi:uracil-DNA glycosylase family 4
LDPNNNFVNRQLPNPARDLNRLVIAEALGEQESLEGRPLVGRSGRVFNSLLESAGIPRDGLTIITVLIAALVIMFFLLTAKRVPT